MAHLVSWSFVVIAHRRDLGVRGSGRREDQNNLLHNHSHQRICSTKVIGGGTTTPPKNGGSGGSHGGGSSACTWKGQTVPCHDATYGTFSAGCYYTAVGPADFLGEPATAGELGVVAGLLHSEGVYRCRTGLRVSGGELLLDVDAAGSRSAEPSNSRAPRLGIARAAEADDGSVSRPGRFGMAARTRWSTPTRGTTRTRRPTGPGQRPQSAAGFPRR